MKKELRSSPIKAKIIGWNPVLNIDATVLGMDSPLTFSLREWKEFEGTPLEEKLQRFAHSKYCHEEDIKALVEGKACRILLSERAISKYIVGKLVDHIPVVSKTYVSLKKLLPDLASQARGVKTQALKTLGKIILKAPEFQGKEGSQLLHQAFVDAYKERLKEQSQMLEGKSEDYSPPNDKNPTVYYSHRFYNEWAIEHSAWGDPLYKRDHWIEWDDAYKQALDIAVHDLDRNPDVLCKYNPNLALIQENILNGCYKYFCGDSFLAQLDAKPAKMLAHRLHPEIQSKLIAQRRPKDAEPVTDDEAREHLYKQREAVTDPRARRVVDFILGRKDVCVTYVGGYATGVKANGEEYGGSAGRYPQGGFYPIEMSTDSSPGMLAHECTHTAINITYHNDAKPFANQEDRKLFVQSLREDTKASGLGKSRLRGDLGITKRLYKYKDIAAEIPTYIVHAKADGRWTQKLAETYPHLTAYVEKIVLPDIGLRAKGKEGFVPRPSSIEELISPDWPPIKKAVSSSSHTGQLRR